METQNLNTKIIIDNLSSTIHPIDPYNPNYNRGQNQNTLPDYQV